MTERFEMRMSPSEICATVQALYDALMARVKWSVWRETRHGHWPTLEWETAQGQMVHLSGAYMEAMSAANKLEDLHPEFVGLFMPPPELWEMVNGLIMATSWDEAPTHGQHDNCDVCSRLRAA